MSTFNIASVIDGAMIKVDANTITEAISYVNSNINNILYDNFAVRAEVVYEDSCEF